MTRFECYIEEYQAPTGLSARIRDKHSNKIIVLEARTLSEKQHFLIFLSQAKINESLMPTVFDRNGSDIIAVYGSVTKETDTTICINTTGGGYQYE